jgi:hypothetical protein
MVSFHIGGGLKYISPASRESSEKTAWKPWSMILLTLRKLPLPLPPDKMRLGKKKLNQY